MIPNIKRHSDTTLVASTVRAWLILRWGMQQYRCYFLDGENHIIAVEAAEIADDAAAWHWAEAMSRRHLGAQAIELWCRERMIHRQALDPPTAEEMRTRAEEYRLKAKDALAQARAEPNAARRDALKLLAEEYEKFADALEAEAREH